MSARTRSLWAAFLRRVDKTPKAQRKALWDDARKRPEQFDQQPGSQAVLRERKRGIVASTAQHGSRE